MVQREVAQGLSKTQCVEGQRHLWEYVRVHARASFFSLLGVRSSGGVTLFFFFFLKTGGRVLCRSQNRG